MQFSDTLPRILHLIRHADPKCGPVCLAKFDLKDGFGRAQLRLGDAPSLAVVLPRHQGLPPLAAIPLVLTRGWENSPPAFCVLTKTTCDLADSCMCRRHAPPHCQENLASCRDVINEPGLATPAPFGTPNQDPPGDTSLSDVRPETEDQVLISVGDGAPARSAPAQVVTPPVRPPASQREPITPPQKSDLSPTALPSPALQAPNAW
mgnify:CR=1 FL=1